MLSTLRRRKRTHPLLSKIFHSIKIPSVQWTTARTRRFHRTAIRETVRPFRRHSDRTVYRRERLSRFGWGFASRLRGPAGDTFSASVAEPLTIDGETVIDRGALVRGRVESAPPSADPRTSGPDRGPDASYVRLTLNSITVGGKVLDLQTSTLFAKDTLQPKGSSNGPSKDRRAGRRSSALGIRKGRRLAFRLIAPVTFSSPNSMPNRQDSNTTANK